MKGIFGIAGVSRRWKLALLLGAMVGTLAATGLGAYAAASGGGTTINACAQKANGQLRLDTGNGCQPNEQAIQWNQVGPQGPPGNTDVTVRHFAQFIYTNDTVTAPVVSASGVRGHLSIYCGPDPSMASGSGNISFTTTNNGSGNENTTFVSPQIPRSSWQTLPPGGTLTFPWANTPNDNVSFDMIIEPNPGEPVPPGLNEDPVLLDIHGFIQQFSFGCDFYVFTESSEVAVPITGVP
jgi:hypothetical protein